jgi:hypothetical protein
VQLFIMPALFLMAQVQKLRCLQLFPVRSRRLSRQQRAAARHFVRDETIDNLWANHTGHLLAAWGSDTIDLHSAKGDIHNLPIEGQYLDFLT